MDSVQKNELAMRGESQCRAGVLAQGRTLPTSRQDVQRVSE